MNWFVSILKGLLLLALFCIFMDLITLLYEYAWVILIVIAAIILIRFLIRPDFRQKVITLIVGGRNPKKRSYRSASESRCSGDAEYFKTLLDGASVDGEISEAEKRVLVRKGVEMGVSPEEAEILVNGRIIELKNRKY